MTIVIDGYLTESKLALALQNITGNQWAGTQIVLPGSRYKWDMGFNDGETLVLVEYDGDDHYRDSMKVRADREKDRLALKNRMRVTRIPYWVQLDSVTIRHYLGLSAEIKQTFPHGFITTKLFPASFCELGIERFRCELDSLPLEIRSAVIESLRQSASKFGLEYVLPTSLRGLLG